MHSLEGLVPPAHFLLREHAGLLLEKRAWEKGWWVSLERRARPINCSQVLRRQGMRNPRLLPTVQNAPCTSRLRGITQRGKWHPPWICIRT